MYCDVCVESSVRGVKVCKDEEEVLPQVSWSTGDRYNAAADNSETDARHQETA